MFDPPFLPVSHQHSVQLLDRFLGVCPIQRSQLQLLAVVCATLAGKFTRKQQQKEVETKTKQQGWRGGSHPPPRPIHNNNNNNNNNNGHLQGNDKDDWGSEETLRAYTDHSVTAKEVKVKTYALIILCHDRNGATFLNGVFLILICARPNISQF